MSNSVTKTTPITVNWKQTQRDYIVILQMTEVRTKLKGLHTELEKTHRGEDKVCPAVMLPVQHANGRTENILFKSVSDARHGGAQHFEGGAGIVARIPADGAAREGVLLEGRAKTKT